MQARWINTWIAVACALIVAGQSQAFAWGRGVQRWSDAQIAQEWRTCPNDYSAISGQLLRMAGEVTQQIKASQGGMDYPGFKLMTPSGVEIPVVVAQGGMQKVSLPLRNAEIFVLGKYIAPTMDYPEGYVLQLGSFPLDGRAGVTSAEWNEWLEFGYEFAVENAFRRLVVIGANGRRMDALSEVDWLSNQKERKDPLVSDLDAVLQFLKANENPFWKDLMAWCAANKASLFLAGAFVVALIAILGVILFVSRPKCPNCGHLLKDCVCDRQRPQLCPICGLPLDQCRGHQQGEKICAGCGLPKSKCTCTQPVCKKCGRPKDECICTVPPAPHGMTLRIDGVPLEQSDATVVLSPFALKVLKGGMNVGKQIPLPRMATVLGREKGPVSGAFIYLDMSDRPAGLEKQCSRKYAKITAHGEILDVEVVATSGNDVRVDGQIVSQAGEVLQAKLGSHIELNPDWEFEVVTAKA